MRIGIWFFGNPITRYKAQVFYTKSTIVPNLWTVWFVVTKDINSYEEVNV